MTDKVLVKEQVEVNLILTSVQICVDGVGFFYMNVICELRLMMLYMNNKIATYLY